MTVNLSINAVLCSYFRQGGGYVINAVCLSVILLFRMECNCRSNQLISLKLGCYDWACHPEELINFWW